jgi:hypothetical protein
MVTCPQHRADMFMDLDAGPREGGTSLADKRAMLLEFLRCQRLPLHVKCEGATPLNSPAAPSSRRRCRCLAGCDIWRRSNAGGLAGGSLAKMHPGDSRLTPSPTSTVPNQISRSWRRRWFSWREKTVFAEQFTRYTDLGFIGHDSAGNPISIRELLVHVIEEHTRHNGHPLPAT